MRNKRLLQDIGLTSYEAAAYLSLLKYGISQASNISRNAEVPTGKIYSVLESLEERSFLEIQASRSKKYNPIDLEMSLGFFF